MTLIWSKQPFFQPRDAYLDWALEGPGNRYPRAFVKWNQGVFGFTPAREKRLDTFGLTVFALPSLAIQPKTGLPLHPKVFGNIGSQEIDEGGEFLSGFLTDPKLSALKMDEGVSFAYDNPDQDLETKFGGKTAGRVFISRPLPPDSINLSGVLETTKLNHGEKAALGENTPVIIGIIDEGIAFAHERFRSSLKCSRVKYAWLQDAKSVEPIDGFEYGRQLTNQDINSLLEIHQSGDSVDESAVYRDAGAADFSRRGHKATSWRTAHGTHVMDVAAGFPMTDDPHDMSDGGLSKDNVHIICVQLPTSTVAETSGLGLEKFYLDAMRYIYDRASKITVAGKALPLVTNFSSGIRGGPRDGSSFLEAYVDDLIKERDLIAPTLAVLPAGNAFLTQSHAQLKLEPGEPKSLTWRIQADDRSFSYAELWLPPDLVLSKTSAMSLRIKTPQGFESHRLEALIDTDEGMARVSEAGENSIVLHAEGDEGDVVCKAYFQPVENRMNGSRGRFLLALAPTHFLSEEAGGDLPGTLAPIGDWTITLENKTTSEMVVNGWVHWDDAPITYSRTGRQSYFADEAYERYHPVTGEWTETDNADGPVKRTGTISGLATGNQPIVVGGYHHKEGRPARYSSADFHGAQDKPDVMAVCEDSNVQFGILGAGTRSGSRVALNGTSVAAPQVARLLVEKLATGMTADEARTALLAEAEIGEGKGADNEDKHRRPSNVTEHSVVPPVERIGKGRLVLSSPRLSQKQRRAR